MIADPGSYRDPSGRIHSSGGRIYRTVTPHGQPDYRFVRESGALDNLVAHGLVVPATEVERTALDAAAADDLVLEHPRIPVISYPYEWPFQALKEAALLHLDIQLEVLDHGVALSDASAFNIQFRGVRPFFIDYLSFRRYREGEPWQAHRQFCEQFLNPLVLQAKVGVPYHDWYRGRLEGIAIADIAAFLGARHRLSPVLLSHVILPSAWQRRLNRSGADAPDRLPRRPLKRSRFRAILLQLRHYVAELRPAGLEKTTWGGYARDNTYEADETVAKRAFVARFASDVRPSLLVDLGCNDGSYAAAALANGANQAVGLDSDHGALDAAWRRAAAEGLKLLPLYQDLANPVPDQGWNGRERSGLAARLGAADGVLALAVVHHLAVARNIPLEDVVSNIVAWAPHGVIEFVPKEDPTVQTMLAMRDDVFADYSRERFVAALGNCGRIVENETVSASGRELFRYHRN